MKTALTLSLFAAGAIVLAGCTPTEDNQRTRQGAAVGAAVGGLAGMASGDGSVFRGDRLLRTAVGAGIGAAVGGAIGATLDAQAAELRRDLGSNVDVRNTGRELIVTLPQDILFDIDSAAVRPDLRNDLLTVAANLNRYPDSTVRVVGHTDNTGSAAHNQGLSERRAAAVASILRNGGVDSRRLVAVGRGMSEPIASNATAEGRRQNRRVEIVIVPHAT